MHLKKKQIPSVMYIRLHNGFALECKDQIITSAKEVMRYPMFDCKVCKHALHKHSQHFAQHFSDGVKAVVLGQNESAENILFNNN